MIAQTGRRVDKKLSIRNVETLNMQIFLEQFYC